MKAVVQRVNRASVTVDDKPIAKIGPGLLVLLAIEKGDGESEKRWSAEKIVNLRIFPDDEGHMNRSVRETGGEILLVPNFTVAGNCRKGRRPSFDKASLPGEAQPMFLEMAEKIRRAGVRIQTGVFGAHMQVEILNDGPVTLIVDTSVRRS